MHVELERKLAEKYPFMRREKDLVQQMEQGFVQDVYGAFGCEVGDGWYTLLDNLCSEITAVYESAGVPVDIVVDQVKEKWGGLSFYYHREPAQISDNRDTVSDTQSREDELELDQKLLDIINKWEDKSETICEQCGKTGTVRQTGYVRTLCDVCYSLLREEVHFGDN